MFGAVQKLAAKVVNNIARQIESLATKHLIRSMRWEDFADRPKDRRLEILRQIPFGEDGPIKSTEFQQSDFLKLFPVTLAKLNLGTSQLIIYKHPYLREL